MEERFPSQVLHLSVDARSLRPVRQPSPCAVCPFAAFYALVQGEAISKARALPTLRYVRRFCFVSWVPDRGRGAISSGLIKLGVPPP